MPLFSKGVVRAEQSGSAVVTYNPEKIEQRLPQQVEEFVVLQQSKASDFRASAEVAQITRLVDLEKDRINVQVEEETLARLKGLEERAYQEAHQLGREEGKAEAFKQYGDQLKEQIKRMSEIADTMHSLTGDMHILNEALLVRLTYEIAQRVLMREVQRDETMIVSVLKGALEQIRNEENIKILVSADDFRFINENKEMLAEALDDLSRFHFESVDAVDRGGCIIETNFGVIDAQLGERIQRVWDGINKEIPQASEVRRR